MIVEAIELLADVLADPDHGINATLDAMVTAGLIDAGRRPGTVTVGAETRDPEAAIGRNLDTGRSVTVFFLGSQDTEGIGELRYATWTAMLGVRVDVADDQPDLTTTELGFIVRATLQVIRQWFLPGWGDGYRVRNGVQVFAPVGLTPSTFAPTTQSPQNTFGVKLLVELRDAASL